MKYRTIVADPPWPLRTTPGVLTGKGGVKVQRSPLPYRTMSVAEIAAQPLGRLAAEHAHLYLWTTNRFLPHAFGIAEAWGFSYSTTLVWCKRPMGRGIGKPAYPIFTEFVLFCRRGTLPAQQQAPRNWWEWRRGAPSAKPEAFIDMVESVSPGPYVELFSRRHRLGWDVWGNESANTATLEEVA